jgi:hypothetical protein
MDMDMQHRQWTYIYDGHVHAAQMWTCSVNTDMDIQHGHTTRTWTCSMDLVMQNEDGCATWTWAYTMNMDIDMQHGHGPTALK